MRTPLAYYGGKQRLAARIVSLMPPHSVYCEPFAGGCAVMFAKPKAAREIINDLDDSIAGFWKAVRDHGERLAAMVAATPYSRAEWNASRRPTDDPVEAARRLLVNVDQSYSRSRRGWSPPSISSDHRARWQPSTWGGLPARIQEACERLRGVCIERTDGVELIARCDVPGAVIYLDPPYPHSARRVPYGYDVESEPDLWGRIADALTRVRHASVIVSGFPCPEMEALGWDSIRVPVRMTAGAKGITVLGFSPETLWVSPHGIRGHQLTLATSEATP